jgi:hypothetical protein
VLVVGGVPVTLLGTGEAGDATGFDHCADKTQVSGCLAGHDAAGRVADLGAVEAEANATHHLLHVVLSEIGVGTTRTARGTIEALVDAAQHRAAIEAGRLWMRLNDLVKSHSSPFVRAQRQRVDPLRPRSENGANPKGGWHGLELERKLHRDVFLRPDLSVQCEFDHGATYDYCRVVLVFNIREGEVEGTDIGGLKVAAVADTPKVMTEAIAEAKRSRINAFGIEYEGKTGLSTSEFSWAA